MMRQLDSRLNNNAVAKGVGRPSDSRGAQRVQFQELLPAPVPEHAPLEMRPDEAMAAAAYNERQAIVYARPSRLEPSGLTRDAGSLPSSWMTRAVARPPGL